MQSNTAQFLTQEPDPHFRRYGFQTAISQLPDMGPFQKLKGHKPPPWYGFNHVDQAGDDSKSRKVGEMIPWEFVDIYGF